jgi:hypothetical protein
MGQYYQLEAESWQNGISFQEKAFALLPADSFVMEQSINYAIAADQYDEAQRLIDEMSQPIHFFGEPGFVSDLRVQLLKKRRDEAYDACEEY